MTWLHNLAAPPQMLATLHVAGPLGIFQKKGLAETALPPVVMWPLAENMRKESWLCLKMVILDDIWHGHGRIDEAVVPSLYQHQDPGSLVFTADLFVT